MLLDEGLGLHLGAVDLAGAAGAVKHVVEDELALGVEDDGLATGAEAGVDGHHALLTERGGEQEFAHVVAKDLNGSGVGFFLGAQACFALHGVREQALVAVFDGFFDFRGCGAVAIEELLFKDADGGFLLG